MEKYEQIKKISYLNLKAKYFELLCKKEMEFDCLNKNYEKAKEISKSYFIDDDHDDENVKIYDEEVNLLKYCLKNIKECKRLDEEIINQQEKLKKFKKKGK